MDGRWLQTGDSYACCHAAVERARRATPRSPRSLRRSIARTVVGGAFALLLLSVQGGAQESEGAEDTVGPLLICNTAKQLNRFVDLLNGGRDAVDAVRLVNEEAQNPTACGNVLAAFEVGKLVAEVKMSGELFSIFEVKITALSDGSGWTQVSPTTQYTIRRMPGEAL